MNRFHSQCEDFLTKHIPKKKNNSPFLFYIHHYPVQDCKALVSRSVELPKQIFEAQGSTKHNLLEGPCVNYLYIGMPQDPLRGAVECFLREKVSQ
ncbi:hypothetical protein ATANTOWER_024724 [Ataeniobius toweri]|uniref:Uncharacterized protein n=1 Tax=Ataeniobius toweri TaxID=208326 RepID=A0ABU7A2C0_9TELE|nr:hypothetical protein [Ataeniobius toweri]